MPSRVARALWGLVAGQPLPRVVTGLELSRLLEAVGLEGRRVENLSSRENSEGVYLPARRLSDEPPLSHVAEPLGLEVTVRFYLVDEVVFYFVEEPPFDEEVQVIYAYLREKMGELAVSGPGGLVKACLEALELAGIPGEAALADPKTRAAIYYVYRDLLGYGPINTPMIDSYVEEVSWFHYDYPVEVVDKKVSDAYPNLEFIPTNIAIDPGLPREEKSYLMRQAVREITGKAGAGLTTARPIAEAKIPSPGGGFHRLASHTDHVSRSEGLTIRKFPEVKMSLTELIARGTLNPLEAAYLLWLLLNRGFILIVGGMASGKTTLLQSLIAAVPFTYKVITIEDTPELSTPTFNWHPLYVRRAPRGSELENIDFTRLVSTSLRHRGTIVTLGEVRGREMAYLIQAAASGHGAICTFHAHDPESVLRRITSRPISVAPENLRLVSSIVHVAKTKAIVDGRARSVRRVLRTFEIVDVKKGRVVSDVVFRWSPLADAHSPEASLRGLAELWARSVKLREYAYGVYGEEGAWRVAAEVYVLAKFLELMAERGIFEIKGVNLRLTGFFRRLDEFVQRVERDVRRVVEAVEAARGG